jgi:hypothetical protein
LPRLVCHQAIDGKKRLTMGKDHASFFRSAIFTRILTAIHMSVYAWQALRESTSLRRPNQYGVLPAAFIRLPSISNSRPLFII